MQSTGYSSAAPQAPIVEPAGAPNASSEAYKKLLDGSGSGQMNLRAVKERAQALRRSLDDFIDILQLHPDRLTWEDSLERFGVMGIRHQQLLDQIRPLLHFYVAFPKSVNQANAELTPLLLSTMKLPDMESEEAKLLSAADDPAAPPASAQDLQRMETAVAHVNGLVERLTHHARDDEATGVLDPKGPRRRAMASELHAAVTDVSSTQTQARPAAEDDARALLDAALRT